MEIPPIPIKYKDRRITEKDKSNDEELFAYFVRQLYFSRSRDVALTFLQMSQLVFQEKNSDLLRRITNNYKNYFQKFGTKSRLIWIKVYEDHLYIWDETEIPKKEFSVPKLIDALEDEIRESLRASRNNYLPLKEIRHIENRDKLMLYTALVVSVSDEFISLEEGAMVTILGSEGSKHRVTILDYNKKSELVAFQTTQKIPFSSGKIRFSNVSVLYRLKEELANLIFSEKPIQNFLSKEFPNPILCDGEVYNAKLSENQKECVQKVLHQDITYIWGPPGTGKSYTLSRLLVSLVKQGERTLVSSTANVAIDGLLEKTSDLLDEIFFRNREDLASEGKILRIGYSQSDKIRAKNHFQITNPLIENLNYRLQQINERIDEIEEENLTVEKIKLKSERDEVKNKLDAEQKQMLNNALMIFCTSAKFISDDALKSITYDNLVIDEGSMMSLPYLLVLASKVKKRIIITGDFKQLGPIAVSNSLKAKRWLKSDLFSWLGDPSSISKHSSVFMLTEQRRMAKPIAALINKEFYEGKLISIEGLKQSLALNLPPNKGHIHFIETGNHPENKTEVASSRSKYNKFSRRQIHNLIQEILKGAPRELESIGVISPYKQQIIDYKGESVPYLNSRVEVLFGTIHTFQGSECDIIIWDIVDTLNSPIGSLYKEVDGERLVNVAISRARSKLIVVGQSRLFHEGSGRELVSSSIKRIVSLIKDASNANQ